MTPVPGHPCAEYQTGTDRMGQFWIYCHCNCCGADWRKACSRPQLANQWVYKFAVEHGHGVSPVLGARSANGRPVR